MAFYSPSEVKDILVKLSQQLATEIRFLKFERLGVKPELPDDEAEVDGSRDEGLYSCSVCKKRMISAHLLDLHVAENHDSYFDLQKDKKPMFACYLEECKQLSATPEKRRDHCIKDHKFPHNFRFDKPVSRKKSPSTDLMDTSESHDAKPTQSKPKYANFHFGQKTQKVFSGQRKPKKDPIETMNVDMKESLPEI